MYYIKKGILYEGKNNEPSGNSCDVGCIPGPGISACHGYGQNNFFFLKSCMSLGKLFLKRKKRGKRRETKILPSFVQNESLPHAATEGEPALGCTF